MESLENGDGDGFEDNDIAPGSSKAALLEEGAFIEVGLVIGVVLLICNLVFCLVYVMLFL